MHRRLDVTDAAAVSALVEGIVVEYGRLDGVLHGAGLLRDAYLANKSVAELDAVLAPKVAGVVNLDRATRDVPLELFVTFSSLAGYGGNPGQADYAAANAFMDHYVIARAERVARGEASGRSVSVNWPLWAQGAMRPDAASVELMRRTAGLVPLENDAALAAFAQAVTGDAAQVLVAAGEREKLLALFGAAGDQADDDGFEAEQDADEAYRANPAATPAVEITAARSPAAGGADLSRMVSAALLDQASVLIKVKPEDIDLDEELAGYGFDSISLTELATELNRTYELDLMPTVFFEHPTLAALTAYLVDAHRETMARHFAPATEASAAILPAAQTAQTAQTARRVPAKAARRRAAPLDVQFDAPAAAIAPARAPLDEPIAIVGLSARMPMAEDADAFWQNLLDGRDCIEEIPAMRWDWQAIYGDPTDDAGRTRVKWGGFIDGIDEFDPHFFGITPREAQVMDPQQRLLMTHVWKAIEDAGYSAQALSGSRTALFVGTSLSGYGNLLAQSAQAQAAFTSTSVVPSIGPNRMSYFLNLHGPSEPIETACSSSLVAINRGITVLRDGSCEMAIVGGINTIVTPDAHVSFSKAGMLSEDGRCKTFSAAANGYVRGEGVGMLVLKRLSDAQAAGDAIYAVIRGGSENHGGRASSLTAPNPQAQAALLMDAYRRSGVDPRTLSYIEAHGTGTKLGDPVEITGLKSAFANLGVESGEQPFCGLGSVKSNIGHLELAAGVAGVIKVVMQMKHATLVKSLHSEPENPYIGLSGSPFYVVRENRPWVAPVDEAGRTLPRRAGVSSFGFGGVNAHVVLEEYVAPVEQVARPGGPALVVLSARTEAALTERAAQLLAWLERNPEVDLYALAYTLQVGRDAMDERLAWAVDSLDELRERLGAFTKDGQLGSGVRGQVKRNKDALAGLAADEDLPSLLATWLAKGKWDRLLSMWAKGLALDWQIFYPARRPRRLHLPVYPFSRERYWAETKPAASIPASKAPVPGAEQLHPLLHANTSNLETQRFTSRFDGSEPFLADHEVQGRRVLPGVAYLEMAHAALLHSGAGATTELVLNQIVWSRPLAVEPGTPRAVHIDLQAEDDGRVSFEIHSDDATDTARRVHGRGVAQARPRAGAASQTLDLDALRARMQRASFTAAQCYAAFEHLGLVYGPSHRGLAELHAGEQEVLARLSLPALPAGMTLAPGLLDSALQAAIGLVLEVDGELADKSPMLPFALRELDVLAPCQREMWVWVATASDDSAVVRKLDITLMDQAGRVCVRLNGFASRRLDAAAAHDDDTLLLAPAWQPRALPSDAPIVPVARRVVLLCGFGAQLLGELSAVLADTHCEVAPVVGEDLGARYHGLARHVFLRLQALAAEKPASDVLVQVVVPLAGELAVLAGLSGLLKTARLEYPRLRTQLLCLPAEMNGVVMGDRLREEGEQAAPAALLRYRDGVREVRVARELVQTPARPIWREDGVYLITGGAGAIGLVFAGEILARAPRARVILSSRSALD
ncbi:SDR family NAD(P)-dependent oxidoreductase, partial [Burkholderia gladioli]|uniref:SDR family NAD(P)-dependent oxidoreductase n=4 Tax=Burkholderia gladioli TaxID=28095 RepID=UPI0024462453